MPEEDSDAEQKRQIKRFLFWNAVVLVVGFVLFVVL